MRSSEELVGAGRSKGEQGEARRSKEVQKQQLARRSRVSREEQE